MTKGRKRLTINEMNMCHLMGWKYNEALNRKNEWLDLPVFIRGNKSFSVYVESLILK